jgi:zinc protease
LAPTAPKQWLAAQNAFASADLREHPGLFVLAAILASGKQPEEAERSLLAELKRVQDQPVTQAELDKAKNQLVTNALRERETNNGKADAIGRAVILHNDARVANTAVDRLQAVTAADVQRVMKKYFTDTNRVVIYYLDESAKPAGEKTTTGGTGAKGGN